MDEEDTRSWQLKAVADVLDVDPDDAIAEARNVTAKLARMTLAARAASMYLPEPERTNFRREYGLGEVTV